jgi:hypothetical protein
MASVNNNDNDEAVNPYLAMREAKIARNQQRLCDLGLLKPPPPPKQKPISKKLQQHTEPIRRSSRLSSQEIQPNYKDGESYRKRTRDTDPEGASSDRTLSASTCKTRANIIPTKETSPKIAPAPSANSVRSISLDLEYLVLGHSKDHTDGLLGKMLERPGKDYVIHKSFAKAAHPEDRQRVSGGESKKLSFNKYSGVQQWKVSDIHSEFNSHPFICTLNRCAKFILHILYPISQLMLLRIASSCGSTLALTTLPIDSYMTEVKSRGMVGRNCMNRLRYFTN